MATVLVVDDSPVDRRLVGGLLGKAPNMAVQYAADGEEALQVMREAAPNLVLTDLIMPNLDGLELVAEVVKTYPLIPVILMTGKGSEQIAVDALKAGAASYVPKSALQDLLIDTVDNVLAVAQEEQTHARLLDCMTGCSFELENDTNVVSALVGYLRRFVRQTGLCDETSGIRTCVALEEALNNALFHGNLEMDSIAADTDRSAHRAMIDERRRTAPYRDRRIHVRVTVNGEEGTFQVRDDGPGFDPSDLPDPTDPANLEKPSGRGLLLMRTFMDDVSYNDDGNEVTLVKRRGRNGSA